MTPTPQGFLHLVEKAATLSAKIALTEDEEKIKRLEDELREYLEDIFAVTRSAFFFPVNGLNHPEVMK